MVIYVSDPSHGPIISHNERKVHQNYFRDGIKPVSEASKPILLFTSVAKTSTTTLNWFESYHPGRVFSLRIMNLHQVLTGAVNPGENSFSVGRVHNQPFTAYASGCDIVILGSDFERVQIIPGAKHGNVQVECVDCSPQGGQIAACYGNTICVFEPVPLPPQGKAHKKLNFQWEKTGQFVLESPAHILSWHPQAVCLLTGSSSLQLWCGLGGSSRLSEGQAVDPQSSWSCLWQCKSAAPVHFIKFSPDGEFFATAGKMDFSFIYLTHPRAVTGFTWRKISSHLPRGAVCNVLLTCCRDSVCRLWAETLLPSDCLLSGLKHTHTQTHTSNNVKKMSNNNTKNNMKNREQSPLQSSWRDEVRCVSQLSHTGPLPQQQNKHFTHRAQTLHANALCHFHIAASINPATDIPLLPSISSMSSSGGDEDEEPGASFTVHWLNNKELHLTLSAELFLQQNAPPQTADADGEADSDVNCPDVDSGTDVDALSSSPPSPLSPGATAAALQHHLDRLFSEWNRAADVLFSIHPTDGSLLVWHVEYLDEYLPGMFRQAQVSFVSRIPVAFPSGDAVSLSGSVVLYACNSNLELALQQGTGRPSPPAPSSNLGHSSSPPRLSVCSPRVLMLSKHTDGSLNQWALSFGQDSAFASLLSVSHRSALNPINRLAAVVHFAHSHMESAVYSELILWCVSPIGALSLSGGVSELTRVNSLQASAFANVAWLPAIIPSYCLGAYGGGSPSACFLASDGGSLRLYQAKPAAEEFNIISQQSTASPGAIIQLQAVTEFQGKETQLLHVFEEELITGDRSGADSLQDSELSGSLFSAGFFLVVVERSQNQRSLLHMWHLQLSAVPLKNTDPTRPDEKASPFNDSRFNFDSMDSTVSKPKETNVEPSCRLSLESQLSSWSLHPDGRAPYLLVTACSDGTVRFWNCSAPTQPELETQTKPGIEGLLETAEELDLQPSTPPCFLWQEWSLLVEDGECGCSSLNLCGRASAVSLCHSSRVAVAHDVELTNADPNVRMHSCSCTKLPQGGGEQKANDISSGQPHEGAGERTDSQANMMEPEGGANANFDRLQCGSCEKTECSSGKQPHGGAIEGTYNSSIGTHGKSSSDVLLHSLNTERPHGGIREQTMYVSIFQCESTGGSEWILEQTLTITDDYSLSDASDMMLTPSSRKLVHLDWVSCEDGSHMLTIGFGSKLYMFGSASGNPPDLGLSDCVREMSSPRLVPLRVLDLMSTVEGSPPLPVALSWARDGVLVVGMDCEMHVYSQWKPDGPNQLSPHPLSTSIASLALSTPGEVEDCGLFEAAHHSFPALPQYHPVQLLGLMDLGKVRRAKAILSHLVKCISKEAVPPKDRALSRSASVDYTEIDAIPPLPLHALLAADQESATSEGVKDESDAYCKLFPSVESTVEDWDAVEEQDDRDAPWDQDWESAVPPMDLSRFGPGSFGREHSSVLSTHLLHSCLPGLSRIEQMELKALADTLANTASSGGSEHGLSSCHFCWAFHSEAEEELIQRIQKSHSSWSELRALGVGWWIRSSERLRRCMEKPLDAALFYLAMKKKAVVWGLFRSQQNVKMTQFFSNNFSDERWRRAALKNAFALLGKQRFTHSAAFFLLAGSLRDAVQVCVEKLQDLQLALVISRLYESEFEGSSSGSFKRILLRHVLGKDHQIPPHPDPFLRSMAHWVLEDYSRALETLLQQPRTDGSSSPCNPDVFSFYTFLRTHPLLLRRHLKSSNSTQRVALNAEGRTQDSISLTERRLFFSAAYAHLQAGCPMLALEVLSKMPKRISKSRAPHNSLSLNDSKGNHSSSSLSDLEEQRDSLESLRFNGLGSMSSLSSLKEGSRSESVLSFDWSAPSLVLQDEPLELRWDSEGERDDDEEEESGLAMKKIPPEKEESIPEASSQVSDYDQTPASPSEDVLAWRLRFSCCLKMLSSELRTLTSGCQRDARKLRRQFRLWMSHELEALRGCCGFGKRRELMQIFLSYCSLHESHATRGGGGELGTVRMELILMMQEMQEDTLALQVSPGPPHLLVPLFRAWSSSSESVEANPIMHLRSLSQDLLQAISALEEPPHPDNTSKQIVVIHSLAESLSSCIYQCLCDGLSLSSQITHQQETFEPDSNLAHWPGASVSLHCSSSDDARLSLSVVLCEVLSAVVLSLFVYGLATHSSHVLLRVVANPLSGKLWACVFGGTARRQELKTYTPPSGGDSECKPQRFRLRSSRSNSRENPDSPPSPKPQTPGVKEHFLPPEISIWEYFLSKPLLPLSCSSGELDSDEQNLPVCSPLSHSTLKTLQRWEQLMLKRVEVFSGVPSNFLNHSLQHPEECVSPGPALLRHKALLEPSNTPFRCSRSSARPVKHLWQFLVKQEQLQETFIRHIFAKNPEHKEPDVVRLDGTSSQANRNCLVIASTHDIQELDVSSILSTQILTWIDEEQEAQLKGTDDFLVVHARDDFNTLAGSTPYTHCSPGTPIHMPWLRGLQTGRGASVLIKRNITNVRRMASHPTLPYYLTGAQDGSVCMFEWGHSQQISCFRSTGHTRVTRLRFNHQGNKFGMVDADGSLSLWQTNTSGNTPKPFLTLQCHNKTANDFVFVNSSSLITTAGLSTDNRNVCLWDTLVNPTNSLIHGFVCHDSGGATVLALSGAHQLLLSGGRRGGVCVFDLSVCVQRRSFQAHESAVKALSVCSDESCFISGSAEGNIKRRHISFVRMFQVWSLRSQSLLHSFSGEHTRQSLFRNLGTGVMQIESAPANQVFSCGADGTMKMRILPDDGNHGDGSDRIRFII
ncbi:hypothetical protein DNTS_004401 [Danionella cerebrum]|uniref:RAVE complex protein Rav1 C-terminal domain-containing protein n=1 Tax=Danionella cerebrum TaxID=2873325 RepID=A0A553NH70_9TELE|nr:hypothetical protein DNTS_004401 [Danionella translucida]